MNEFRIEYEIFEPSNDIDNALFKEFEVLSSNIVRILKQEFRRILSPIASNLKVEKFTIKLSINQLKKTAFSNGIVCVECFTEFNNIEGFLRIENNDDLVDGFLTFSPNISLHELIKKIGSINPLDVFVPINLIYFEDDFSFEKDYESSGFKSNNENKIVFDFNKKMYSFFKNLSENKIFDFRGTCDGIMLHYKFSENNKAWISFLKKNNNARNVNKIDFFELENFSNKDILKTMVLADLLAIEAFEVYKTEDDLKYIFDVSKLLGY